MYSLDPQDILRRHTESLTLRQPHESDWRTAAMYCLPRQYGMWQATGNLQAASSLQSSGQSAARIRVYDSTAMKALPKYATVLERMMTPQGMKWHKLAASDPSLMAKRAVQLYFDDLNDILFKYRYQPRSGFSTAQAESYTSLGAFGTGIKFIKERRTTKLAPYPGLNYRSVPLRNYSCLLNEEGRPDTHFYVDEYTARQIKQKFPDLKTFGPQVDAELKLALPSEKRTFTLLHMVAPNEDYEPGELTGGKKWPVISVYLIKQDATILQQGGYYSDPYIVARTFTEPGVPYGYSPAQQALGAIGGANAMKKTYLKQGQKAVDPPLLAADDGVLNGPVGLTPGFVNYGGMNSQGQKMIAALEMGRFDVMEKILADERGDIDDAFFGKLFSILTELPEMTATQVMERVGEKATLLAPTMGRLQTEDLGPTIDREIDILARMRWKGQPILPEMPPELQEADGEYEVIYTSPMAQSVQAEEASAFMAISDWAVNIAANTQNPAILHTLDYQAAIPDIARIRGVPARWMTDPEQVQALNKATQDQQETDQAVKAAPALAGAAKALMPQNATPKTGVAR